MGEQCDATGEVGVRDALVEVGDVRGGRFEAVLRDARQRLVCLDELRLQGARRCELGGGEHLGCEELLEEGVVAADALLEDAEPGGGLGGVEAGAQRRLGDLEGRDV